jgi:hypothetical protein
MANVGPVNSSAMDKLLKEASEYDKKSQKEISSNKSGDKGDFNENLLDGPMKNVPPPKAPE